MGIRRKNGNKGQRERERGRRREGRVTGVGLGGLLEDGDGLLGGLRSGRGVGGGECQPTELNHALKREKIRN